MTTFPVCVCKIPQVAGSYTCIACWLPLSEKKEERPSYPISKDAVREDLLDRKKEERACCELCGEPMPIGEDMFKFHGYSGDCPKPPKSKEPRVEEWEGEFDSKFDYLNARHTIDQWHEYKIFIRSLLAGREESWGKIVADITIKEERSRLKGVVEELKRNMPPFPVEDGIANEAMQWGAKTAYRQALDDIIKAI